MKRLTEGKVIIIPDWHQSINFCEAILNKEKTWDKLVFLGDELDCFEPIDNINKFSVKECCRWINKRMEEWGDDAIWLLGNHTLAYLASYTPKLIPSKGSYYSCSGWTRNKAKDFNRNIDPKWFKKIELCCKVGDFYCVHGGFSYRQFKPFMSEAENVQNLYDEWEKDKLTFHHQPWHWINFVGPARYGMDEYSSPIWQDWSEYTPLDETQIICGHTQDFGKPRCKKNPIGLENWCIDGGQTCYCVWQDGKPEVKFVEDKDYSSFLSL